MKKYILPLLLVSLAYSTGVFAQTADTTTTIPATTTTTVIKPLITNVPKEDLKSALNIVDNGNLQISIKAGMVTNVEGDNISISVFNQIYKTDVKGARITNAKWINLDKNMIRPGDIVNIFGTLNSDFSTIVVKTFRNISLRDIKSKARETIETTTTTLTPVQIEKAEQLQDFQNTVEQEKNDILKENGFTKEVEQKHMNAIQSLIEKLQNLLK